MHNLFIDVFIEYSFDKAVEHIVTNIMIQKTPLIPITFVIIDLGFNVLSANDTPRCDPPCTLLLTRCI